MTTIKQAARRLRSARSISLDIETYGLTAVDPDALKKDQTVQRNLRKAEALDPMRGHIRLLQLHDGDPEHEPIIIDLKKHGYDLGPLAPILHSRPVYIHNANFDLRFLRKRCGLRVALPRCTLSMAQLLNRGTRERNDLDTVLTRHLDVPAGDKRGASDWSADKLDPAQLAYAGRDVIHLQALHAALNAALSDADLTEVWRLERDLLPVIVDIEMAGVHIDLPRLVAQHRLSVPIAEQAEADCVTLFCDPGLNIRSPQQVRDALARNGVYVASTDKAHLRRKEGKHCLALLAARAAYHDARGLRDLITATDKKTHRIHTTYRATSTDTGRFSSSSPNLQNVRRDRRAIFSAPRHRVLVSADYSQIELRIAAVLADETRMLDAYRQGVDLHASTAAAILDIPLADVTPDQRRLAKAVNFGLIYGQQSQGLVTYARDAFQVVLTEREATAHRASWFRAYPGILRWHNEARRIASIPGTHDIRTRTGRRRISAPGGPRSWDKFAQTVNTTVQGGAADVIKLALTRLHASLDPSSARIVLQTHDDIVVECRRSVADRVSRTLTLIMLASFTTYYPEVPMEVEPKTTAAWGA